MRRRLRSDRRGVHRVGPAVDHVVVERVLYIERRVGDTPEAARVRLVLGEEQIGGALANEPAPAGRRVLGFDHDPARARRRRAQSRPRRARLPRPRVSKPQRRQHVHVGRVGPAVGDRDADQHLVDGGLRVLDDDVEVAIVVEDAGVEQLVFARSPVPARGLLEQQRVGKRALRILVEVLHVGVGRRVVEVEAVLLDVLAVIALRACETEEALLEDHVAAVPEGQREAESLVVVRDAGQAVLAPAVGARAGVIVREIFPGRAPGTVIFAYGAPLPLGQVRAPAPPVRNPAGRFRDASMLLGHARVRGILAEFRRIQVLHYAMSRLLWLVPTLLAMALVTFLVMHATPGSPLDPVAEGANPLSPESQKALAAYYGLDKPLWQQFAIFVGKAVRGDFGFSFVYKTRTVAEILRETFPISLLLGSMALVLAVAGGLTLGILAAIHQNRGWDYVSVSLATVGVAVPNFVLAVFLIIIFSFMLPLFPTGGWDSPRDWVLPTVTLALAPMGIIARFTRASMLEVIRADFTLTARGPSSIPTASARRDPSPPTRSLASDPAAYGATASAASAATGWPWPAAPSSSSCVWSRSLPTCSCRCPTRNRISDA